MEYSTNNTLIQEKDKLNTTPDPTLETYPVIDITENLVWDLMPHRIEDSHKGTYGKLLCVAGSSRFRGAAALCTEGALRGGCGIVTLASVEPVFASIQARMPECILYSCRVAGDGGISGDMASELIEESKKEYTAILMGSGMGNSPDTEKLVRSLADNSKCTIVLDADALNSISPKPDEEEDSEPAKKTILNKYKIEDWPKPSSLMPMIITPHPGEMARLCNCTINEIKAEKEKIISSFAHANNCIVVFKEHNTLIAEPNGTIWKNNTGNSGLARGGSGDILAGLLGSFAALGMDSVAAAICAVWLHGAAADRCALRKSRTGMLPHDIFEDLQSLFLENGR